MHVIDRKLYKRVIAALADGARAMESSNQARQRGDEQPVYFAPTRIEDIQRARLQLVSLNDAGEAAELRRELTK